MSSLKLIQNIGVVFWTVDQNAPPMSSAVTTAPAWTFAADAMVSPTAANARMRPTAVSAFILKLHTVSMLLIVLCLRLLHVISLEPRYLFHS